MSGVDVLVTDMDDTLLDPKTETLPDASRTMLKEWMARGMKWIIATGRMQDHTESMIDRLGVEPNFYITRSRYIHPGNTDREPPLESWNQRIERRVSDQLEYTETWIPLVKDWASSSGIQIQVGDDHIMFDEEWEAERAFQEINDKINDDFKILRNRTFFTVVPKETGKGNCLKYLCDTIEWSEPQLICVGDGMNDANMLDGDYDFRTAAVANAEEPLKRLVEDKGGMVLDRRGGEAIEKLVCKLLNHEELSL